MGLMLSPMDGAVHNPGQGSVPRVGSSRAPEKGSRINHRITYVPREDATPEGELAALAAAYSFVIRCHEAKRAAGADGGEEGAEHGAVTGTSQRHAPGHK